MIPDKLKGEFERYVELLAERYGPWAVLMVFIDAIRPYFHEQRKQDTQARIPPTQSRGF